MSPTRESRRRGRSVRAHARDTHAAIGVFDRDPEHRALTGKAKLARHVGHDWGSELVRQARDLLRGLLELVASLLEIAFESRAGLLLIAPPLRLLFRALALALRLLTLQLDLPLRALARELRVALRLLLLLGRLAGLLLRSLALRIVRGLSRRTHRQRTEERRNTE